MMNLRKDSSLSDWFQLDSAGSINHPQLSY